VSAILNLISFSFISVGHLEFDFRQFNLRTLDLNNPIFFKMERRQIYLIFAALGMDDTKMDLSQFDEGNRVTITTGLVSV
jgi:hypothetical protein